MIHEDVFPFRSAVGHHLLIVDGSRVYDVDEQCHGAVAAGELPQHIMGLVDGPAGPYVDGTPLSPPPLRALSLNVAQGCNLACGYCYADQGKFGGRTRVMPLEVALGAVDQLIAQAGPGKDAVLGFMGGEPLLNRKLLHELVPEAARRSEAAGVRLRYSITTNATLVTAQDVALFSGHPFTVTVSLDGDRKINDRQRPTATGNSSFDATVDGLRLLASGAIQHLSIRATVTPTTRNLPQCLASLMQFGADEVGFAPVLVSPTGAEQFGEADFGPFLEEMIACGEIAKKALLKRCRYPFSNFETAIHEIAKGTHRPYPCGAAAAYASVSATGGLFACHRAIDDPEFAIGSLSSGLDQVAREQFLAKRHVSLQEPCASCWARQLCGGGCHHEVAKRGRIACDYVRGWLEWCLGAYAEIAETRPEYFTAPEQYFIPRQEPAHA